MTDTKTFPLASIRQGTIDFVKTAITSYCTKQGLLINSEYGPGFRKMELPCNQLDQVVLGEERCHLDYPGLQKTGHFLAGVRLMTQVAPDEHGSNYAELMIVTEHGENNFLEHRTVDLTRLQRYLELRPWTADGPRGGWVNKINSCLDEVIRWEEEALKRHKRRA